MRRDGLAAREAGHAPTALVAAPVAADIATARLVVPVEDAVVVDRWLAVDHRRLRKGLRVLGVHGYHAHLWRCEAY